jgi:hypothetical protein
MVADDLLRSFAGVAQSPDPDLAVAALMIARIAYPKLDPAPYLSQLDALGREAAACHERTTIGADKRPKPTSTVCPHPRAERVPVQRPAPLATTCITAIREQRTTCSIAGQDSDHARARVMESPVGRAFGRRINFLAISCCDTARHRRRVTRATIIDAHHRGALLTDAMCWELLHRHTDTPLWDDLVLAQWTKRQILVRMLLNLKRVYLGMYSFPQARDITELLLAVDPSALDELRDRGLLAYHLSDYSAALRDLETYLNLSPKTDSDEDRRKEHAEIWEHIKTLRRRLASMN